MGSIFKFNYYYHVMDFQKLVGEVATASDIQVCREHSHAGENQGHPFWGILYPWPPQPATHLEQATE